MTILPYPPNLVNGPIPITQNTTIALQTVIEGAGIYNIGNGVTLTLNGPLDAGPYQIFDVSAGGTVALGTGACSGIKVEWFGASGTASAATNTSAFTAAAIAANGAGLPLLLQPGVTYAGSISLPASATGVRVLGIGAKLQPTAGNTGISAASPTNLEIVGLEIDGSNQSATAHGVYVSGGTRVRVRGCHVHHVHDHGIFFDGGTDLAATDNEIDHCGNTQAVTGGAGCGVFARGFTRLVVANNRIHNCPNQFSHGILAFADAAANAWSQATITGNVVDACGANLGGGGGIAVTSSATNASYRGVKATISGNTINNSGDGGIWINADEVACVGNVIDGTQFGWGVECEDCADVQVTGNTVKGAYLENIYIWPGNAPVGPNRTVTVSGNVIDGSQTQHGVHVAGTVTQVVIDGNQVRNNASNGIFCDGAGDVTIAANQVWDNETVNSGIGGIRVYGASNGHVTITGNRSGDSRSGASKTQTYGVAVQNGAVNVLVAGNDLSGNKTAGVWYPTLGAGTVIRQNAGFNPVGVVTPPAFPASNTTVTNTTGYDLTIYISLNGGTISQVQLPAGGAVGPTSGPFRVQAGSGIFIGTVTGSPSWVWVAD